MNIRKIVCFIFLLFILLLSIGQSLASTLNSSVTNKFSPFGPLPATTTNIFWVNQTASHDYADMIYQGTTLKKRLKNVLTPGTTGTVRISDAWNGQDDNSVNCSAGTYDAKIYISRTSRFDRKIPANDRNLYPEFREPRDIACDRLGNVYVFDRGLLTVQKFSSDGAFIWRWTIPAGAGLTFPNELTGGISVNTNYNILLSGEGGGGMGRVSMIDQDATWVSNINAYVAADDNFGGMGISEKFNRVFTAAQANRRIEQLKKEKDELEAKGDIKGTEAKGSEIMSIVAGRTEPIIKSFMLDYRNQSIFEIAERVWKSKKSDKAITELYNNIKKRYDTYHGRFILTKQKKGCLSF